MIQTESGVRPAPWFVGVLVVVAVGAVPGQAQTFPPRLTGDQANEIRATIERMKGDPRGPYARLRWYCNDGSVLPPAGSPCTDRGGGVQHAELSDAARRLEPLGFHVGTILQGTPVTDLFDLGRNHYRLKELVLSQFLFEVDDGWVLRQARYYRGARQIEDEERSGRELLIELLRDTAWTESNFMLLYQLAAAVPHEGIGAAGSTTRTRNLATELAALDERYQRLRIKIHSLPGRDDLVTVEALLASATRGSEAHAKLLELRGELARTYDPTLARNALDAYATALPALRTELTAVTQAYGIGDPAETLHALSQAGTAARELLPSLSAESRLSAVDFIRAVHDQAFSVAQALGGNSSNTLDRAERIRQLTPYVVLARAAGFLSRRESRALLDEITHITSARSLPAMEYRSRLAYLGRGLEWGMASARSTFGTVHQHYQSVEARAAPFLDAMVRASVLLPLSNQLTELGSDADRVLGASHELFGTSVSSGARGLNAGVAVAQLELAPETDEVHFDPTRIYVLPETGAELRPVAGVVTLDEGNLLSHVQLLARNLGIPNAAVLPTFADRIRPWNGRRVFYAVSPLGRVILKDASQLTATERALTVSQSSTPADRITLDVSRLQLDRNRPIILDSLRATHAGVIVGPKAANLGQLKTYFPDQVAPGVALPFGMFYEHINRPFEGALPLARLAAAHEEAAAMRAAGRDATDVQRFMFQALADVRRAIVELEWLPQMRSTIELAIAQAFEPGQGVFIRSDTNVEDLPQFSGAGLNLTVPHRITTEDILASIKQVWTSPFSERAYLWRSQILSDQSRIYPSVLLLQTVPSEKSGVLITTGLANGSVDDITISTAEGVGGAVEGEETETILVDRNARVRLISQAKAPYRRVPAYDAGGGGGMRTIPSQRPDYLLDSSEIQQLLVAVADWRARFPDAAAQVWDIEFGFVSGQLWLFQIRPFVQFRNSALIERLATLDRDMQANADRQVLLTERIP